MPDMRKVAVYGVGIVYGDLAISSRQLDQLSGSSALDWLTLFEPPGNCEHAGEVSEEYDWKKYLLTSQHYASRSTMLAAGAARLALDEAQISLPIAQPESVGVCLGTRWGCLDSARKFYEPVMQGQARRASAQVFSHSYPNSTASLLAIEFGLGGYSNVFSGSSCSGLQALSSAAYAISSGTANMMLCGAVDALSELTVAHGCTVGCYADTAGQEIDFNDPQNIELADKIPAEAAAFMLLAPSGKLEQDYLFELSGEMLKNSPKAKDASELGLGDCGAATDMISLLLGQCGFAG